MSQGDSLLFDSHAHLTDEAFEGDVDPIVIRAREAGVGRLVTIGLDAETSSRAKDIAHKYNLWFTAGIHPAESAMATPESIVEVKEMLSDQRCVAVGEIGLDFYWPEPLPEPQYEIFHKMLELARETGLPIVIHQRNSFDEVIKVLDEYVLPGKGVFHCFGGSAEQVEEIVGRGFYASIAGNVTYKKGNMEEAVRVIPLDRLMIETDSPYLTPVPYRGTRNEPAYIKNTATKVSEILQLTIKEIEEITFRNASTLFRIPL